MVCFLGTKSVVELSKSDLLSGAGEALNSISWLVSASN